MSYTDLSTALVLTAPSPATSGTSLVVDTGTGSRFDTGSFYATAHPANAIPTPDNAEIVLVTARTDDTFTITRAQKGTTAKSIATGWRITASVYADVFNTTVLNPSTSTDNAVARFDGTTGKLVQNSSVTISDTGVATAAGFQLNVASTPTLAPGLIRWNATEGVIEFGTGVTGVTNQVGLEVYIRARNNTGVTIPNGSVVYVTGALGNRPTIALADSDSLATAVPTIGVTTHDIANNTDGYVTVIGVVRDFDTSAFTAGDVVYLSGTPGGLTTALPAPGSINVRVGVITVAHAVQGEVQVNINDLSELINYQPLLAEGPFVDGDKTKLDGIEALADVTDATNVNAAGATMNSDTTLAGNGYFLDEDTMTSNSDTKVPSQQSVKAYIDAAITSVKSALFPVGSYYINETNSTNPATLLGFGTWTAVQDTFLVGRGSTYTGTGGAATHTHPLSDNGQALTAPSNTALARRIPSSGTATHTWSLSGFAASSASMTSGTALAGNTDSASNIPPYQAAYIWKRTA